MRKITVVLLMMLVALPAFADGLGDLGDLFLGRKSLLTLKDQFWSTSIVEISVNGVAYEISDPQERKEFRKFLDEIIRLKTESIMSRVSSMNMRLESVGK